MVEEAAARAIEDRPGTCIVLVRELSNGWRVRSLQTRIPLGGLSRTNLRSSRPPVAKGSTSALDRWARWYGSAWFRLRNSGATCRSAFSSASTRHPLQRSMATPLMAGWVSR